MNKCLFCYLDLEEDNLSDYHKKCNIEFYGSAVAPLLPYKMNEMEILAKEAIEQSITVPGVQPKLSLGFVQEHLKKGQSGRLTILDALDGLYILKPQNSLFSQMPENEHLSMKLAKLFRINTVPSNMIRLKSGELCFITKRIDRSKKGDKIHMIDFMQILDLEDKYKGTMENLGKEIGELSENTLFDKLRFFELAIFNFLIGNNDMHHKNFSMYLSENGWVLSPAYDLLNVKLILPKDKEDSALLLGGKKQNFNKGYFDRLAEVLKLNKKQVSSVYKRINKWKPQAFELINISFLNSENKKNYKELLEVRAQIFE